MMSTNTHRLKTTQSSSIISSSDHRPTVVLCSSKDEYLLSQDICTLCGSLGKADEGNLISCSQCGQCYHPFCVNIKGLKVVISKGWRCLECTVCETCGLPGDEAKLLLCDECELSCHTYCLNPPLEEVPQGSWKCHWCVVCQRCGIHSPGVNSDWQKNHTECGPCSSQSTCAKCKIDYNETDLIIQCIHCSRWLHAHCDSIRDEEECELASELGYTCLLCRPKDQIPLYIVQRKLIEPNDQRQAASARLNDDHPTSTKYHDIISGQKSKLTSANSCNNEEDNQRSPRNKSNQSEFPRPQSAPLTSLNELDGLDSLPKRPASSLHFTSAEAKTSLVNGSHNDLNVNIDGVLDKSTNKLTDDFFQGPMADGAAVTDAGFNCVKSQKPEPAKRQRAKRGTKLQKLDDCNLDESNRDEFEENKMIGDDKDEDGKKRRVRKLSKLGLGGFLVRQRGSRINDFNYGNDTIETSLLPQQPTQQSLDPSDEVLVNGGVNPKSKRIRRRPRKRTKANLIDQYPPYMQEAFFGKELLASNEPETIEKNYSAPQNDCSYTDLQLEKSNDTLRQATENDSIRQPMIVQELNMNKQQENLDASMSDSIEPIRQNDSRPVPHSSDTMDLFFNDAQTIDRLGEQSKDGFKMDQIKTDPFTDVPPKVDLFDQGPQRKDVFDPDLPKSTVFDSDSKKDSLDPLLNPEFNLDMVAQLDSKAVEDVLGDMDSISGSGKNNQLQGASDAKKNSQNYEMEEALGPKATKSAVLYANLEHPNLRHEFRNPEERYKQIQKLWRQLPADNRKLFVERARENRTNSKTASKPTDTGGMQKKLGSAQIRPPSTPRMPTEAMLPSPQSQVMTPSPMPHSSLDTRWRQPMPPVESPHQANSRFLPSPHQQPQPQIVYSPSPHHQPGSVPMQHSPSYADSHQNHTQQMQPQLPITMQQNQYSPSRQPQYIHQPQRMPVQNQQQFAPNQHMMRVPQGQVRMQQVPQQQQVTYQSHRPPTPRFHGPSQPYMSHDLHQPHTPQPAMMNASPNMGPSPIQRPQIQPQQVASPQLQMGQQVASPQLQMSTLQPQQVDSPQLVAGPQMGPNQFHPLNNFIDNQSHPQPPPSQSGQIVNQYQVTQQQQAQPQQAMYNNNHHTQVNPRRQFQSQPSQIQQQSTQMAPNQQQSASLQTQSQQQLYLSQQPRPTQVIQAPSQQQPQMIYNSTNMTPSTSSLRLDLDDAAQIIDDDDDLKDLGADFNILEYADPEPEKGASTSAGGKSNFELDATDLDEYFVDRDGLEEKKTNDPLFSIGVMQPLNQQQALGSQQPQQQQQLQPTQQISYSQAPHHPPSSQIDSVQQHNQGYADSSQQQQHHLNMQHQQAMPTPPNHYAPQRPQYVSQPRPISNVASHQQYVSNQPSMMRTGMQPQIRVQQSSQQPMGGYQQSAPPPAQQRSQNPRFHHPDQMNSHELQQQQQQHMQQQPMMNPQQVGSPQMRPLMRPQKVSPPQLQRTQMRPQQVASPQLQRIPMNPQQIGSPQIQMNSMQPQQNSSPQLQMQQSPQIQTTHQYHQQQGFIDTQPTQQQVHNGGSNMMHQQQQQQTQQYHPQHHTINQQQTNQHVIYSNQHNPQMSQRRPQFQPQQQVQPPSQQQQQHYGYQQPQQHQVGYSQQVQQQQQMIPQQNQQQMMGQVGGEMMMHEKSPIIGEPITSMQFSMYEQGSGSANEAINPLMHSKEPPKTYNQGQDRPMESSYNNNGDHQPQDHGITYEQQIIPIVQQQQQPQQPQGQTQNQNVMVVPQLQPQGDLESVTNRQPIVKLMTEQGRISSPAIKPEMPAFKFAPNTNASTSGRLSSVGIQDGECIPQDNQPGLVAPTHERPSNSSGGASGGQPQNQLLKQLLGNCSSADSPNHDGGNTSSLLLDCGTKTLPAVGQSMIPKQYGPSTGGSGIPTISFQLDTNNKAPIGSLVTSPQPLPTVGGQIKPSFISQGPRRSSLTPGGGPPNPVGPPEIITYNVGPQVQPTVNLNIQPVQQMSQPVASAPPLQTQIAPIVHLRPEMSSTKIPTPKPNEPILIQPIQQQRQQPPPPSQMVDLEAETRPSPIAQIQQQIPRVVVPMQSGPGGASLASSQFDLNVGATPIAFKLATVASKSSGKSAAAKKRNDYMAKRRADLEKEPTPPPREIKPKKRARGPNKRTRVEGDDIRTIDSNSNTSETSNQLPELMLTTSTVPSASLATPSGPPPRKRVRKTQNKTLVPAGDLDSSDPLIASLAMEFRSELPKLSIQEPEIRPSNNIACMFACGDLNSRESKLRGTFGNAVPVASYSAQLNRKGGKRKAVGFYHEEFPEDLEDPSADLFQDNLRSDGFERGCDSPGSIISGSSANYDDDLRDGMDEDDECTSKLKGTTERFFARDLDRYLSNHEKSPASSSPAGTIKCEPTDGLDLPVALLNPDGDKMDLNNNSNRAVSPSVPITSANLPITTKSISDLEALNERRVDLIDENDKENQVEMEETSDQQSLVQVPEESECSELMAETQETTANSNNTSLNMRLKDHGDVSVTLTLTNKEADGVKKVLSSLTHVIGSQSSTSAANCQNVLNQEGGSAVDDNNFGGNSFRLLTGAPQIQESTSNTSYKGIKFNEQNFVPIGASAAAIDRSSQAKLSNPSESIDVKPEFCCRCKAIVVDRGIRKNISEIPEQTFASMQKISIVKKNQIGELVFCSVHCYAASIMCLDISKDGATTTSSFEGVKVMPGLPPMSPMMEDDEDDPLGGGCINNYATSDGNSELITRDPGTSVDDDGTQQQQNGPQRNLTVDDKALTSSGKVSPLSMVQRKRWVDIRYTRWTPSHFDLNKSTSPINMDDPRFDSTCMTTPTSENFPSAHLVSSQGESSIDSNESDNSTSYSQSTSGRLASSSDDCQPQIPARRDSGPAISGQIGGFTNRLSAKDFITPWPEEMELIQVLPIKRVDDPQPSTMASPRTSRVVIKKERQDTLVTSTQQQRRAYLLQAGEEFHRDTRKCVLCHELGDGNSDGPARLLNLFVDGWVHLNCALWSLDVYELANGALMNVELACKKAMACSLCHKPGATLKCFKPRCPNYYHFVCATNERCSFYEDKSVQCRQHSKLALSKEMTSFVVKRRVYINRDEQKQVAEMIQGDQQNVMRIGSLVFLRIGQLLPHQLASFHDQKNIFPVGYKVIRYYWSYRRFNKRCKYLCSIEDDDGKPQFRVLAQEHGFNDELFTGKSPRLVWQPIIKMIVNLRKGVQDTITTFPKYIRGEDLFGLDEPSVVRILESIPGVETLTDYDFNFGRSPLLELPLAINPTGCARSEPKLRTHFKRPYTIHTATNSFKLPKSRLQSVNSSDSSSPYIKQFVHSKSSQYKKMKSEWRNNVVLARSRVQGLGLYAARDIEKHTMIIEYIGMLIRNEIAERYERIHEAHNRGIYMFRLDEDRVIDATLAGGLARYINHSCNPNCVAEAVEIDRERKILIIANRKILKGEELVYDYKLAIEDDQHKISCLCGAPTCKKWMN